MNQNDFAFSDFANNKFYSAVNKTLIELADLSNEKRVVDLACGTGMVTRQIANTLKDAKDSVIIAMDHSQDMLKIAAEELKDISSTAVEFVESKVEEISGKIKDQVDVIFFCNAIHYVSNKDEILNEINNLSVSYNFIQIFLVSFRFFLYKSFYNGAHPPETELFARKWMIKSLRTLRKEYGLKPEKSDKVESRKQLTISDYEVLLQKHGFAIKTQIVNKIPVPLKGWIDISTFKDFISGVMPGVPLSEASKCLTTAVTQTFEDLNTTTIPRNWLNIIAVKQ